MMNGEAKVYLSELKFGVATRKAYDCLQEALILSPNNGACWSSTSTVYATEEQDTDILFEQVLQYFLNEGFVARCSEHGVAENRIDICSVILIRRKDRATGGDAPLLGIASLTFSMGCVSVALVDTNFDVYEKINQWLATFKRPVYPAVEYRAQAQILGLDFGGDLCLFGVPIGDHPLIEENYSDKVIDQVKYISSQIQAKEPFGRISIFQGPPGTGKTFLIRSLISSIEGVKFIVVPADMIGEALGPKFATFLLNESLGSQKLVFILEDADACLAPRKASTMNSISNLLNLADGIFGNAFDIRIIATSNTIIKEFDPAVVRPGRLAALVNVDLLSYEKAAPAYYRLTQKILPNDRSDWSIADVYEAAHLDKLNSNSMLETLSTLTGEVSE